MGQRILGIIALGLAGLAALLPTGAGAGTDPQKNSPPVAWNKIPAAERKVLAPLEKDWAQIPPLGQRRMITAAKQYPKMAPVQQERFQERIREWAALTPEQRKAARDKYQDLSKLPPEKQHQLRERWNEKSAAQKAQPPSIARPAALPPATAAQAPSAPPGKSK